jgi:hypothetical protein
MNNTNFHEQCKSFNSDKIKSELFDFRDKMENVFNMVALKANELIYQHEEKYNMYGSAYMLLQNIVQDAIINEKEKNKTCVSETNTSGSITVENVSNVAREIVGIELESFEKRVNDKMDVRFNEMQNILTLLTSKLETLSVGLESQSKQITQMHNDSNNKVNEPKENIKLFIEEPKSETDNDEQENEDNNSECTEEAINAEVVAIGSKKEEEETEEVEEDEETEEVEEEVTEEVEEKDEIESESSEDEELFEIEIDGVTYCTNNEDNGEIYELSEEGEVGEKIGYLKAGEPIFSSK